MKVRHFISTPIADFVKVTLHLKTQTGISYKLDWRKDIKGNDNRTQTTPTFCGAALSTEESLR